MRKRFVRLAIVAVVVLIAFMMYRSTEGFGDYVSPSGEIECANGILPAKYKRDDKDYICVRKNAITPSTKLPAAVCGANYKVGSWKNCPADFVQRVKPATHRCYTCTK
jgi:hypothetical protein